MTAKNSTIAAALVGGYLLGRTRKARMAVGVGMFLAGRRLDLDPRRIGKLLAASPVTGALSEQVRRELFEATKSAAARTLTQRASGLADSLQRRTKALGGEEAEEPDGHETESETGTEAETGDGAREDAAQRTTAKRTPKKSTAESPPKKSPPKKSTPRKSTSRSSSRGGSSGAGARKTTASRTRKGRSDDDG
ncbi:hypothetical protein [Streptomyces venezuelae]|uniref:hypothetical protein n=1 Tax=Streptomyces venezuelae TaxID=54571 RepID=UPI0037D2F137